MTEQLQDTLALELDSIIFEIRSRAEAHGDNLIGKGEVYAVLRARAMLMTSCKVNLTDIFIAGFMAYLEDAVRFNFIGVDDININKLTDILVTEAAKIERSTEYGAARLLQADSRKEEEGENRE